MRHVPSQRTDSKGRTSTACILLESIPLRFTLVNIRRNIRSINTPRCGSVTREFARNRCQQVGHHVTQSKPTKRQSAERFDSIAARLRSSASGRSRHARGPIADKSRSPVRMLPRYQTTAFSVYRLLWCFRFRFQVCLLARIGLFRREP